MYYIKDRGFRGGGYLKAEGEGVFGAALFPIEIRILSCTISLKCADFLVLVGIGGLGKIGRRENGV